MNLINKLKDDFKLDENKEVFIDINPESMEAELDWGYKNNGTPADVYYNKIIRLYLPKHINTPPHGVFAEYLFDMSREFIEEYKKEFLDMIENFQEEKKYDLEYKLEYWINS